MKSLECIVFKTESEFYKRALELRYQVLRKPLNLEFTELELEKDKHDLHFALVDEKDVVACLTLTDMLPQGYKMRQVAVSQKYQNKGLGKKLNKFAEDWLIKNRVSNVFCNARESAVSFYEKMGYMVKGQRFMEVGIPHFYMEKSLKID